MICCLYLDKEINIKLSHFKIQELRCDFSILMSKIINELSKNEENLKTIKNICAYLPYKDDPDAFLFSKEQQKEITSCTCIDHLFTNQLRGCWRWDDFPLLKKIIQSLESKECKKLLSQYESKLVCTMKLQDIYEHCQKENLHIPNDYHKLVAVIENNIFSQITKKEYDALKKFIVECCGVYNIAIPPLFKGAESSLQLEWFISSTVVSHMVETATRNSSKFIINSFVYFRISTKVIFDERKFENVRM